MTTVDSILCRLTNECSGTDKELFTEEQLVEFAQNYVDKWDEDTSGWTILLYFVDFWCDTEWRCRCCSECGKLFTVGYCVNAGDAYYCSDECLHSQFTDEEWEEECENNEDSYYTEW